MLRRRQLMCGNFDPDAKYLKHWWCGQDDAPDGILRDRMGTGFDWKLVGNPIHENGEWVFDGLNTYGVLSGKQTSDWDLGHHYRVSLDADIWKTTSSVSRWSGTVDLGSIFNSDKNIGFIINNAGAYINWKLKGNDSNPGIAPYLDPNYPKTMVLDPNILNTVKYDIYCVDKGNGYDKYIVVLNGETYEYQANVPKVEYNSFENNQSYISRGVAPGYYTGMRLRNLKIYVYD